MTPSESVPIYSDNFRAGTLKPSIHIHARCSLPIPYSCCNLPLLPQDVLPHVSLASLSGLVFIPLAFIAIVAPWSLHKSPSSHLLSFQSVIKFIKFFLFSPFISSLSLFLSYNLANLDSSLCCTVYMYVSLGPVLFTLKEWIMYIIHATYTH